MTKKQLKPVIKIVTNEFILECDEQSFNVSDRRDQGNWPVIMVPQHRPKTAIKAFYSWVEQNRERIETTPGYRFVELYLELDRADIEYHYFCSCD